MKLIAPRELARERIAICKGCEHLRTTIPQCKKCGCIVHAKAMLPTERCPIGKW